MKKLIQFGFLIFLFFAQAQQSANRFYYELSYKPHKDSTKIVKEMMVLDVDNNRSVYQSFAIVEMDSLLEVAIEKMKKTGVMMDMKQFQNPKKGNFAHRIFKDNPIHEIKYTDYLGMDSYAYKEQPNFNWKINSEKQKIGEYNTQKATTSFGGRNWTAWFSTDLPIQNGPYKFYGLPGLIVKIEDADKNYSWELKGNKKISKIAYDLYMQSVMNQSPIGNKTMEVSKEKFNEKYEAYKKDPMASIKQMMSQLPPGAEMAMPDGQSVSKMMKEAEEKMKEELKKNNNSIEINTKKS